MKTSKSEKALRNPVVVGAVKLHTIRNAEMFDPAFRNALETIDDAGLDELCADKELSAARRNCAKSERKRREKAAPDKAVSPVVGRLAPGSLERASGTTGDLPAVFLPAAPDAERREMLVAAGLDNSADFDAGRALVEQYRVAVGGMRAVLIFAAMLKQVRARLDAQEGVSPARGGNSARRGPTAKGGGIDGWLKRFAPEISSATAYRFEAVYDAVREQFMFVPPAAVAKLGGFEAFVLTPPEQLPAKLQPKQQELWEFVEGTSQRSWLDKFKEPKPRGGDTSAHRGKREADPDAKIKEAKETWAHIDTLIREEGLERKTWGDLPPIDREIVADNLAKLVKLMRKPEPKPAAQLTDKAATL